MAIAVSSRGSRPPNSARPGPKPEINVTPLVDVVLVLLIIFMVIAPQLEAGERVELPAIGNIDEKSKLESTTLTVTASGRYLLEKDVIEESAIPARLAELHQRDPEKRIVLKADRTVKYGRMRALFNQAQTVGFPGVALMVDQDPTRARQEGR
jgi:biopolymer transport protein TolR